MTNVRVSITSKILPPSILRLAHDFECDDPRHSVTIGYVPRVWKTNHIIPEAFKLEYPESQTMTLDWALFWRDLLGLFAPQEWKSLPANLNDGNDWTWFDGFVPASELDKWYLHLIHGARAFTNKTGPNNEGYYDPVTGFGGGPKAYRKEGVVTGGNICWNAGRDGSRYRIWCLDGLKPPPSVSCVNMPFLIHTATQCTPFQVSKTPLPDCPNGTWKIIEFPQADGRPVPVPLISTREDMPTMTWNGLYLRQNAITAVRVKEDFPPPFSWPYV